MRVRMLCVAVLLCAWSSVALAQLDVDTTQGPLTLSEDVTEAFTLWQDALADEELDEPTARIAYAPELLGPETASLTLRWSDGQTDILLAPDRYRRSPVLLHEIGLLLGLSTADEGVMDPVLRATSPTEPTATDIALLRDVRAFPPADIDRSGRVDFYDLAALGAAFGSTGVNLAADLNDDGTVDEEDLAILREAYVFTAPARPEIDPAADPDAPQDDAAPVQESGDVEDDSDRQEDEQDEEDEEDDPDAP